MDQRNDEVGGGVDGVLRSGEVEEVLANGGGDLKVVLGAFEVDEEAAGEQVTEALLAVAGRRGVGDLRARLVETVSRAVHARWSEADPLEEDDAVQ